MKEITIDPYIHVRMVKSFEYDPTQGERKSALFPILQGSRRYGNLTERTGGQRDFVLIEVRMPI
jgi:hypothetical protein